MALQKKLRRSSKPMCFSRNSVSPMIREVWDREIATRLEPSHKKNIAPRLYESKGERYGQRYFFSDPQAYCAVVRGEIMGLSHVGNGAI